ncbi:fructan beta-fructosidase [Paenibacillus sophorae]|uniref:Fructan beta-fructosidase n=1 Tax=Paenibacillus sophorae TaxID=1333845 RepID=A0A1H8LJL5_9BACL|nr:glycoside hydrolase family 32 protein [Paenibacillus sophorae]QWU17263.1 glycoside hydrolase family 32 protein [Paenibacillus sophorae]SEO05305.1 fructan beta-fructosidase [Paenibacillus sophorae]
MSTKSYSETFRPQFHYSPEANWLNDPNGLVWYEGEYHLFYQHHPHSTVWGPMHWGHAVSKDLVYWEELPIALWPDHNGAIFSGSAVVDWHDTTGFFNGGSGLVAVFTHHDTQTPSGVPRQSQSLAYSSDKGRTWTMYEGNPVLEDERHVDYRDPKVFWDSERERWAMVLAAGQRILFYHSPDLIHWSFGSEFGASEGSHDGVWECPDLFRLPVDGGSGESKWVLIVSIGPSDELAEGSRTQYFVGEYDGVSFVSDNPPDTVLWLDHGRDNYAGVTWSDVPAQDGRRLFIGWMNNWKYANLLPTEAWRGAMTLPRELGLAVCEDGVRLRQMPVKELEALREKEFRINHAVINAGDGNLLQDIHGSALEIEAEIKLTGASAFGFRIHGSAGQGTVIGYDASRSYVFIDRRNAGISDFHPDFSCEHGADLKPSGDILKLRIFADHSSVEVFAGDGRVALTDQVFPGPEHQNLELYVQEGSIEIISLHVYGLKSIWDSSK